MNSVTMTHDEALEIVSDFENKLFLKGSINAATEKEKAVLKDALTLMAGNIEDDKRQAIMSQKWNELKKEKRGIAK